MSSERSATMKALVLEAYDSLVYRDMPVPDCSDHEVLVRIEACGICGSDAHGMDGSSGRRVPPLVMGHEASGVIAAVGAGVEAWKKGDRVTFDSTVYPLNDWYTLNGRYNLSDGREVVGVSTPEFKRHGAFAEYVAVPEHVLHRIPDAVSFEQAAMVEPIAVALHALGIGGAAIGQSCAVVGVGMIGVFILQLLKLAGVSRIVAFDIDERNRKRAERCGADCAFDGRKAGAVEEARRFLKGRGADIVFEAVGIEASVGQAIDLTRKGGTCVLVGNLSAEVTFPLQKVVTQELKVLGSCAIRGEYPVALDLLESGRIDVSEFVAEVAPLSEGAEWFQRIRRGEVGGKVILKP